MSEPQSFSELALEPAVLEALAKMGFETMTPVQAKAIPHLLSSCDFVGQAPTGTGKTAAFGIPLVNRIEVGSGHIQALIIGPTRELVQQIADELNAIGEIKGVKALAVFGGERIYSQKERLRQRDIDIVVGTPGRVLDHIGQVSLNFSRTRLVVLDEADEMLDMGFRDDIEAILKHTPGGRETWLFSATISPEIRKIADRYMYFPQEVRIAPQAHSQEMIDQQYYIVNEDDKIGLLKKIIEDTPDIYGIVFCQTKKEVVQVTRRLRDRFPFLDCLHGAMPQSDRDQVMAEFRERKLRMLISTDVVGRGIDIDSLTHIINLQPPNDPESYIHRIGRTARKGESGIAITFFAPHEGYAYRQLERRVGMSLQRHPDSELEFEEKPVRHGHLHRGSGGRKRSGGGGGHVGAHSPSHAGQTPRPPQRKKRRRPGGGGGPSPAGSPSQSS
jgi:ATP-dependent RNA helicase DeaD